MSRIIKFILFLAFFLVFFEAGLISAYTIVTSESPDVGKLIDMQVDRVSAIFNFENVSNPLVGTPETLNITNTNDVVQALQSKSKLDGIDLKTLNATTFEDTSSDIIKINITAMGYKENKTGGNRTGGQIVITPSADYMIKATASAKTKSKGIEIDVNTIKIVSLGRIYTNRTY